MNNNSSSLEMESIIEDVKISLSKMNNNKLIDVEKSFIRTTYEKLLNIIQNLDEEMISLALKDVHYSGVMSLPIQKVKENGTLKRFFFATEEIPPLAVQLHSHKYDLNIIPIQGNIIHHRAYSAKMGKESNMYFDRYEYSSGLNGKSEIKYKDTTRWEIESYSLPIGSFTKLYSDDIHTMSCSSGSIWLVEEIKYVKETSTFLGIPFNTSKYYSKLERKQTLQYLKEIENELLILLENYK